jgi:small subunit ribosomal protein S8
MTMTDPIADMLTRIRNANVAMHDDVTMPSSKLKESLAAVLQKEGYIRAFHVEQEEGKPSKTLVIDMKYSEARERVITGIRRVSKPGLRVYTKADAVPRVLGGLGVAVVSTSKGLLTDREARSQRIGGEILCYVW